MEKASCNLCGAGFDGWKGRVLHHCAAPPKNGLYVLKHYNISDRFFSSEEDLSSVWSACGRFIPIEFEEVGREFPTVNSVGGFENYPHLCLDEAWELVRE